MASSLTRESGEGGSRIRMLYISHPRVAVPKEVILVGISREARVMCQG